MRTIQLAGRLLLGTVLMVGCAENSPTESTDASAFVGRPESPGSPQSHGRPESPGRPELPGPPGEVCVPFESLVGEWTATSVTFEGGPDLVVDGNLVWIVTFMSDGTFTEVVENDPANLFCDGPSPCTDDGRYIQTDVNLLICDPGCGELILEYTISGNTLTISFDGGEEDPPFTATLVRT